MTEYEKYWGFQLSQMLPQQPGKKIYMFLGSAAYNIYQKNKKLSSLQKLLSCEKVIYSYKSYTPIKLQKIILF